jgi:uncharacterized phiE125 gp8 family phage protein
MSGGRRWGFGWNYPLASGFAPPRTRRVCIMRPTDQPVTLDEAVLHLRLDPTAATGPELPLITRLIAAATTALEEYASVAVMQQDWRMTLRHWPLYGQGLPLPLPPFAELLRIRVNQVEQPIADYYVEADDRLAANLYPVSHYWPAIATFDRDAVIIEWRAGVERPEDVSETIKQAILMAVGTWYENRESLQQFVLTPMIEIGWKSLIDAYREPGFA